MLVKWCSKSFKLGFSSACTENLQMNKLGLEMAEEPEIQLLHSLDHREARKFQKKTSTSASLNIKKAFDCWSQQTVKKFLQRWEEKNTLPVSWETCRQLKKQQLELDMEQLAVQNCEKSTSRLYIVPFLFNLCAEYIMWNARLDDDKLESRFLGKISTTSDMQVMPL